MPKPACNFSMRLNGSPVPYLSSPSMLVAVSSYFSVPTPSGASEHLARLLGLGAKQHLAQPIDRSALRLQLTRHQPECIYYSLQLRVVVRGHDTCDPVEDRSCLQRRHFDSLRRLAVVERSDL